MTSCAGLGVAPGEDAATNRLLWFRTLSYPFSVACEDPAIRVYIERVLAHFADPSVERSGPEADGFPDPTRYEVIDRGPSASRPYQLVVNGEQSTDGDRWSLVLDYLFWHINVATPAHSGDFYLIHAGSVVAPDGTVVLLPAVSGSGKSTLVAGLVEAGFGYLSDEAAAIDPVSGTVYPFPKTLTLKEGSPARVESLAPGPDEADLCGPQWHVDPELLRPGSLAGPAPLGLVVALRRAEAGPPEVTRLTPGQTCMELATNSMSLRRYGRRALPLLARLAESAPGYRLASSDLPSAVEAVIRLVEEACTERNTGPGVD